MTRAPRRPSQSIGRYVNERRFHRWLRANLPAGRSGPLPLGDDIAALRLPRGRSILATTDALVEGTHFVARSPPEAIGRAAAAVSLSDVASKGGTPMGLLLDLLVPRRTPERWLRSVAHGAEALSAKFGAHLVGGDTKASAVACVVGTVIASADPRHLPARSRARPGDLLVVTGRVGAGGLAWERYRRASRIARDRYLRSMLNVHPRLEEGRHLAPIAHAMLDTSDGLAEASHLLSEASRVRLRLDEESIPWVNGLGKMDPAVRRRIGFYGGDYELLAAIPPGARGKAERTPGAGATVIGRVEAGSGAQLSTDGGLIPLPRAGWQPFRSRGARSAT